MANNNQFSVDISGSGDHIVIPAMEGHYFQVLRMILSLGAEVTVQFKSGATALSGPMPMLAMLLTEDDTPNNPWCITNKGEAYVISLGGNAACGGLIWGRYV